MHAAWIGQAAEQRFRIEGKLLGTLDHPNIARLLDAGLLDDAQPYLVLEHVAGEPIDVYCARHELGVEERVRLFLNVLAAVGHAHSHLIVHRDLKPANIYITREGSVKPPQPMLTGLKPAPWKRDISPMPRGAAMPSGCCWRMHA